MLSMINQPGGPVVNTGDIFTDDQKLIARTKPTPMRPFFVAENLGDSIQPHQRHSIWCLAQVQVEAKFEVVVYSSSPGNIYHVCHILNDDHWNCQAAARSGKE